MPKNKFVRGSPGKPASRAQINFAKELLSIRKRQKGRKKMTYQEIANRVGIFSRETIRRWDKRI